MQSLSNFIRKAGASLCFVGYFPFGPGTAASALVVGSLFLFRDKAAFLTSPEHVLRYWVAAIALTALSIALSSKSKEVFGRDDAPQIVIDEVVGQFITFFMIPMNYRTLFLGFFLFRFFDIVKPFPVHAVEEIEGGVGVTMDDVVAGVMANITLLTILFVYHWIKGYL